MKLILLVSSYSTYCINGFNAEDDAVNTRNKKTTDMFKALKIITPIKWVTHVTYNDAVKVEPKGADSLCPSFKTVALKNLKHTNLKLVTRNLKDKQCITK